MVASSNPGKLAELRTLLSVLGAELLSQSALGVPQPVESGESFSENALIKARNASRHAGLPAIADDSGLVVDALGGAPGVRSARYAGEGASDAENTDKLLEALAGVDMPKRTGRFVCVVAFVENADDPAPLLCQAAWEGRILESPRGAGGFGYDPVFFVCAEGKTAAELSPRQKNALSHRGQALQKLLLAFRSRYADIR